MIALSIAAVLATLSAAPNKPLSPGKPRSKSESATDAYLRTLDLNRIMNSGVDFTSPRYSAALRLHKPLAEIDENFDYDFERLAQIERKLAGVSRRAALQHIFKAVTEGARTDTERHLAILRFLHAATLHSGELQPMYADRTPVSDPLVLLEVNEMRCQQAAQLAIDLFECMGYQGRLVQLGGHVIAEIKYEDAWHYLDADLFANGQTVIDRQGHIPSVVELSKEPLRIDSLPSNAELALDGGPFGALPYPSGIYFSRQAYAPKTVVYYQKIGSTSNRYYGWNKVKTIEDQERVLSDEPIAHRPPPPELVEVSPEPVMPEDPACQVLVRWRPVVDPDGDLLGYRVFVSTGSRRWNYSRFLGDPQYARFASFPEGWKPEMYPYLSDVPASDLELRITKGTEAMISVPRGTTAYVSVMSYDAHGIAARRVRFPISSELALPCSAP